MKNIPLPRLLKLTTVVSRVGCVKSANRAYHISSGFRFSEFVALAVFVAPPLADGARLALRYNYRLNACRVTDSAVYISQGVMMESRKFDVISMGFVIAGHLIQLGGSAEACLAFVTLGAANW